MYILYSKTHIIYNTLSISYFQSIVKKKIQDKWNGKIKNFIINCLLTSSYNVLHLFTGYESTPWNFSLDPNPPLTHTNTINRISSTQII